MKLPSITDPRRLWSRIVWPSRIQGALFASLWLLGIGFWAGQTWITLHHLVLSVLGSLVALALVNTGTFLILSTPIPRFESRRTRWWSVGSQTSAGLSVLGACAGGLCTVPVVAGWWGLSIAAAAFSALQGFFFWMAWFFTVLAGFFAWRHSRRLVRTVLPLSCDAKL